MGQDLTGELQRTQIGLIQALSAITRCRQRIATLEAGNVCREAGVTPRFPIDFRAQFAEDQVAWEALGRPTSGFFIEAGAFDGVNFSVTYALEAMGWTGLLVEPHPVRSRECGANRPNSRVVQAVLTAPGHGPTVEFVTVEDRYGGMLSYVPGTSQHAASIEQQNAARTTVKVLATTLDALLESHTGPIDLVSLDVEGHEVEALKGFTLARWRPRMILIEDDQSNPREDVSRQMHGQAYSHACWVECNRLYVTHAEPGLAQGLARALMMDT